MAMDEFGRNPVKLKTRPRIIIHPPSQPMQTPPPPPPPPTAVAGLEELVLSGYVRGLGASMQDGCFCLPAGIENNSEFQFTGAGRNAEEALADLKAKVLDAGMVI